MSTQVYNATGGGLKGLFPDPIIAQRDPVSTDIVSPSGEPYQIFQGWENHLTSETFIYLGGGNWVTLSSIAGDVTQLSGNTGVATPAAGNINVVGAGTLAFAGSGSTLTGTITPGTGLIATLTGDSGGAISPTAGNENLLGTANQITTTGSGSTITWSLPAAITAPGSLTTTSSLSSGTTITAGTGITATTGGVTATAGNLVATAGNLDLNGAASKININTATGASASAGTFNLVSGAATTVATTSVTASSIILLTRNGINGSTALGELTVGTIDAGVHFTVYAATLATPATPLSGDTSTVGWVIIN